jgi:hypothetical protein
MKTFLILFLFLFGVFTSIPLQAQTPAVVRNPLEVSIAIPFSSNGERVLYFSKLQFPVLITNRSERSQGVWKDWNSWGYYAVFFEVFNDDGKMLKLTKIMPHAWTMNFPDHWIIPAGESLVIDVDLSDSKTWNAFPKPDDFPATFMIRAVLEIAPDDKSKKYGVWTGRAESKLEKYTIYNPR